MEPVKSSTNNNMFKVTATESKTVAVPTPKKQVIFRIVAVRETDGRSDFVTNESNAIPINQLESDEIVTRQVRSTVAGEGYNTNAANKDALSVLPRPAIQGKPYQLTATTSQTSTPAQLAAEGVILSNYGEAPHLTQQKKAVEKRLDKFIETESLTLMYMDKKELVQLANYTASFTNLFYLQSLNPNLTGNYVTLAAQKLNRKDGCSRSQTVDVKVSEVQQAHDALKKQHPQFGLNADCSNATARIATYFSCKYEDLMDACDCKIPTYYDYPGWQELEDGSHRYLSAADPNCLSERRLPDISGYDMPKYGRFAQDLLNVAEPQISLPLLLHMHAGYVAAILEDAGHPLQYILNLVALTSSYKTTLGTLFTQQFGMEKLNFNSTDVSLELLAAEGHDAGILLDDIHNAFSKSCLEKFIKFQRQYCDTSGRGKSINGGTKLFRASMRTAVTVTSESTLEQLQESGKLRLVCIKYDKSAVNAKKLFAIDKERIRAAHEHRHSAIEIYLTGFIRFLESHYDAIFDMMMDLDIKGPHLRFARQEEAFRTLCIISIVVLKYWQELGIISEEAIKTIYTNKWVPVLVALMQDNEAMNIKQNPVAMYLSALNAMMACDALHIAPEKQQFIDNSGYFIGFWEKKSDLLRLDSGRTYDRIMEFYRKKGFTLTATESDILTAIYDAGLSTGYKEKNHKDRPYLKMKIKENSIKTVNLYWQKVNVFTNGGM